MEKTNKKTLEEIIRVDHAGERGAIKIYEGQLLALKTFKQNFIFCWVSASTGNYFLFFNQIFIVRECSF